MDALRLINGKLLPLGLPSIIGTLCKQDVVTGNSYCCYYRWLGGSIAYPSTGCDFCASPWDRRAMISWKPEMKRVSGSRTNATNTRSSQLLTCIRGKKKEILGLGF